MSHLGPKSGGWKSIEVDSDVFGFLQCTHRGGTEYLHGLQEERM